MDINHAIIRRMEEICQEKNINICETALNGGKSPSAIYDLIKGRTKCSKVSTIKAFCLGAGITLSEFFNRDYFNDFED
ncbi:MAG: helix-turn-helix transcriptional regulator [Clostridia bacterium]|nr:helix-turn-helix transcriptional regulator [Clostridia bacterium]